MILYRGIADRLGNGRQQWSEGTGVWLTDNFEVAKTYATSGKLEIYEIDDSDYDENKVVYNCNYKLGSLQGSDNFHIHTPSTVVSKHNSSGKDIVVLENIIDLLEIPLEKISNEIKQKYKGQGVKGIIQALVDAGYSGSTICIWNPEKYLNLLSVDSVTSSRKNIFSKLLESSYSDFDWQTIKQYCNNLVDKDFSKIKTVDDLYNYLNDYFEPLQINIQQVSPYYDDQWVSDEIANGATYSNGFIDIYVDFDSILDIVVNNYKSALKDFCNDLAKVITHEMTHRYQSTQYEDRKWGNIKTQQDYLKHKDEISAHIIGGVAELLDLGYNKEDLLKALRTIDSDLEDSSGPYWQSDSIYTYWDNFGSYDNQDTTWKQVKKELYSIISNIEE